VRLKPRLLLQSTGAFLALTLLLSAVFFSSIDRIRGVVFRNSTALGDSAAEISAYMLEVLHTEKINRTAIDTVMLLDERLGRIESLTQMAADMAGSILGSGEGWSPRPLPLVAAGEVPPPSPYMYAAAGVDFSAVRAEAELLANVTEILRQINVVDWDITTGSISSESGFVIAVDAFPWVQTGCDPRGLDWYVRARDTGRPHWTVVYGDRRGRGAAFSFVVPFFDGPPGVGVFAGAARSTVRLADLSGIIDPTGIRRSGQFFILSRCGLMVYSTEGVEVELEAGGTVAGQNFLETGDARLRSLGLSMTLGATGMTELEMDGIPFYVAYAPIRTLGWSLGVTVPAQEIHVPAARIVDQIWEITEATRAAIGMYIRFLVVSVAVLFLAILPAIAFFSLRFTRAVTGPVLALSDGVREVAGGNLGREVVVKTGDELELLADSFNVMTSQLRRHIAQTAKATAERQRMDTELDIAMRIQSSMLPNDFPPFRDRKDEFDLYAEVHPAKEVGGDFYDFFFIDEDRFAVLVADVAGKGIPAALFMATTKTVVKNRLQSVGEPELALELVNRELCEGNIANMFVTLWLCILEIPTRRLTYVNAGHNPPMLLRGSSRRPDGEGFGFLVSPPDLVLAGMDDTCYHCRQIQMEIGDTLFLYTDGILEAADPSGAFYGKERLKAFLDANASRPLREMLPDLRGDVEAFADGAEQSDDITMVALRVHGGAHGEGPEESPLPLTLKAELRNLATLIEFIGAGLCAAGCPPKELAQTELAVEEVFVNIVNYAYPGGERGKGEVTVSLHTFPLPGSTVATLVFFDHGVPFNPLEHREPDVSAPFEEREPGGLGILIVKKLIDTIGYSRENGANRLEFTKSWTKEET